MLSVGILPRGPIFHATNQIFIHLYSSCLTPFYTQHPSSQWCKKSSAHTLRRSPGFVSVIRGRKTYHCLQFRTIYYRSATTTILYQHQWYIFEYFQTLLLFPLKVGCKRMIGWSHDPTIHQAIKAYDYQEEQRNKKEDFLTFHRELRRRGAKKT